MTCFGGYCGNADVRVGEQDTDKGVAKHMRVDFADARFLSHAVNNFAIVVGADGPAEIIDNDKIFSRAAFAGIPGTIPTFRPCRSAKHCPYGAFVQAIGHGRFSDIP